MPQAESRYHALPWKRPTREGKAVSFPVLIERAIDRLQQARNRPNSAIGMALAKKVPVYRADGQARQRRLRSDGAQNLVTLLMALLATADLKSGLVAVPVDDHTRWERKTWAQMDYRAFGAEIHGERSQRRTERWARVLVEAGWVRVHPWKKLTNNGEWRSLPGLKFVTDKFWKLVGLYEQVKKFRKERDRRKGQERVKALAGLLDGQKPAERPVAPPTPAPAAAKRDGRPPPTHDGPRAVGDVALAEIAKMRKMLGMK